MTSRVPILRSIGEGEKPLTHTRAERRAAREAGVMATALIIPRNPINGRIIALQHSRDTGPRLFGVDIFDIHKRQKVGEFVADTISFRYGFELDPKRIIFASMQSRAIDSKHPSVNNRLFPKLNQRVYVPALTVAGAGSPLKITSIDTNLTIVETDEQALITGIADRFKDMPERDDMVGLTEEVLAIDYLDLLDAQQLGSS